MDTNTPSRRGFIATTGTALAGAMLAKPIYKWLFMCFALSMLAPAMGQQVSAKKVKSKKEVSIKKYSGYLFTYFTGSGKDAEAIRFAISNDGYNFKALNNNKPVINPSQISATGGVRDPHILRGVDGKTFYMVATDMNTAKNGWGPNHAMVLLKSQDLINWSSASVNIAAVFSEFAAVDKVWAPQTIYDSQKEKYMVYWSMSFPNEPIKLYYAYANQDFTGLETSPKQLFVSPDNSTCLDADIVFDDGKYHLFFKSAGKEHGIKKAVSTKLTQDYVLQDKRLEQTDNAVEGSGVFKLNNSNTYILMYDLYSSGKYQFTKSADKDLNNFTLIDSEVSMDFHPRHGTVMAITSKEEEALVSKWLAADGVMRSVQSPAINKINIVFDSVLKRLTLPVKPATDLAALNPEFISWPGISISPVGKQNFSNGPVNYTVQVIGRAPQTFEVVAKKNHNPILPGYYADPDILYAEKTGKFYLYPTTDGFDNWSGTHFKTFSSTNLVEWKDEGIIVDLIKDVSWAKRNAWAPCIVETKIAGVYKYFYYFCAAQKIGVAVADNPTGPFVDSGKPLIDAFPEGVKGGQQIDPDVFFDPKTNKHYLYWGNGYMAGAELNDDMVSIRPGTTHVMTPDHTFREGIYVFYRKGVYYFMWSEDDTRSENYKVRYGTSDSPLGKITIPENNLVIAKDKEAGIYGTGHNSVIQIPRKDEWYIVYHRFNYPNGITMGEAAGYNREVCIDRLEFKDDGSIKQVKPTHEGIAPISPRSTVDSPR